MSDTENQMNEPLLESRNKSLTPHVTHLGTHLGKQVKNKGTLRSITPLPFFDPQGFNPDAPTHQSQLIQPIRKLGFDQWRSKLSVF